MRNGQPAFVRQLGQMAGKRQSFAAPIMQATHAQPVPFRWLSGASPEKENLLTCSPDGLTAGLAEYFGAGVDEP